MSDPFDVLEQGLAGPMERRRFLKFTGALAGSAAFCQLRPDLAHATTPLSGYPFTLGVASGDPASTGAVLWTRLAPEIYEPDGGVPHRRLPVEWRVAKDPAMRRVVRKGITLAIYPVARQRIIDHLAHARVRNPVLITGDWHSTFVNDIKRDFSDPGSATVATEFVGTSISSNGDFPVYGPYYGPMIDANPHIKFFDGDRRGYVRCLLDRHRWRTDLRMVSTVSRSDAPVSTFASFVVEDGRPGAVHA